MAIFGKNKTEKKAPAKTVKATKSTKAQAKTVAVPAVKAAVGAPASVLIAPHVTEKAGLANEKGNMYTFKVTTNATKHTITHEVKTKYKVTPTKVNIVILPGRQVFVRGKKGMQSGFKKAYVFLKKGDKIDFA